MKTPRRDDVPWKGNVQAFGLENLLFCSALRPWNLEILPGSLPLLRSWLQTEHHWPRKRLLNADGKRILYSREVGDTISEGSKKKVAHMKGGVLRSQKQYLKLLDMANAVIHLQPQGPGCNDRSRTERSLNILTSLPFLVLGAVTMRKAKSREHRALGAGFLGVGLSATAYHSTTASVRTVLRKADYYTISICSLLMTRALHDEKMKSVQGKAATLLTLAATPFKPTLVTACHTAAMEVEFAKCARKYPQLRGQHRWHSVAAGAGLGCFLAEDTAIKHNINWLHSLWHCLACYGISSVNTVLNQKQAVGCVSSPSISC